MRSTCIQHPTREPLIVIRQWQLAFCEGNHCAAALLSLFEYWHNLRLDLSQRAGPANAAARQHGQPATQDESLLQFHSDEQLQAGLLGLYGTNKIREGRRLLVTRGAVTEHPNPNPRYAFDKTLYFQFHPEVINAWLDQRRNTPPAAGAPPTGDGNPPPPDQNALSRDSGIINVTCVKNNDSCVKNNDSCVKNAGSYTEITYEITTETTTTPPPPSFTDPDQRPQQEGGSGSSDGEKTKDGPADLVFDGSLANLSTAQQARAQQIISALDPETAQQVLDDWGQAIKTHSIRKSRWAWLEGVTRKAQAGTFTPTTDATERRAAEKRRREAQEASIRRIPTRPLLPPENRPKGRPEGLKALLKAISPSLGRVG